MQTLFEKHVAENYSLVAFSIYAACRRFQETNSDSPGLSLEQAILVPALVFHRKTAESFANRTRTDGLFYRVLTEDIQLTVGLQARLQDSFERTMKSIHLGTSAKVLFFVQYPEFRICSSIIARPGESFGTKAPPDTKLILKAADRIGYCLASTEFPLVCTALRIRF